MKITVIGAGNMGGALIKGWAKVAAVRRDIIAITATARTEKRLAALHAEFPSVRVLLDNREAVQGADVVVLAVKPWLVEPVIQELLPALDLTRQAIVSVAANISTKQLRTYLRSETAQVFYAMPNIAAEFGESMTFVAAAEGVAPARLAEIVRLFTLIGPTMACEERMVASGMMMAGCGIAYVFRFLRAMQEAGVEMGFYPHDAQEIAMQTMQGAVTLLKETNLHPEVAIDKVTTPGGVTIKGLNELDHAAFNSAVIRCLKAGLK